MNETRFLEALLQAENNSVTIFDEVSEPVIWRYAPKIILDKKYVELSLLLMLGIEEAFAQIKDKGSLTQILNLALTPTIDGLIFETAQRIILTNAKTWERVTLREFYRAFENAYLLTRNTQSIFVTRLAIEARIMLPMLSQDERQIHSAIGFLLDEFPIASVENYDLAEVIVKAIKLLRLSHEFLPNDSGIIDQIQSYVTSENSFIKSEACFSLGLVKLHSAFSANNNTVFSNALEQASYYFEESSKVQENRADSELLQQVCKCFRLLNESATSKPSEVSQTIHNTRGLLLHRLVLIGGFNSTDTSSIEFNLVKLIVYLEEINNQLDSPRKLLDLTPRMKLLADLYKAISELDTEENFNWGASQSVQKLILWPRFTSKFMEVQEIIAKLERQLCDQSWREKATSHEIRFYEIALHELKDNSPNESAAIRLQEFRVAAELINPKFGDIINNLQAEGQLIDEVAFQILREHFDTEEELYPFVPSIPAQEICKKILPDLRERLNWKSSDERWKALSIAVQATSNFFHHICKADKHENTNFLFAEKIGGRGNNAKESDLEKYFIDKMEGNWPVERQPKNETPGRADLFFRWKHGVNFPIEVKVEESDISLENIRKSYLSQPHLYATTTSQVSFLFVLDVILKDKPAKFEAEYWYIDSLEKNQETDYPIYTVVVIFPANRYRPSDYSWGKT